MGNLSRHHFTISGNLLASTFHLLIHFKAASFDSKCNTILSHSLEISHISDNSLSFAIHLVKKFQFNNLL
ncbi:hypothetical protein GW891_03450 [bacterium]|nr:hypothetical protein [bacterium]